MKTIKRLFTIVCVLFFTCNLCWGQTSNHIEPSDRISDVHWSFKDSIISVSFHFESAIDSLRRVDLSYRYCDVDFTPILVYINEEAHGLSEFFTDYTANIDTIKKNITISSKMICWPLNIEYSEMVEKDRILFFFTCGSQPTITSPIPEEYVGPSYIVEKSDYEKLTSCLDIQSNQLEYKYCLLSGIWVENQPQEGPYIQYSILNDEIVKCDKFINLR